MLNKPTQRFNANREWFHNDSPNVFFYGFIHMLAELRSIIRPGSKMIEIGSYMGESTMLFACTQLFSEINTIEPFVGEEEFNQLFNYDWKYIKEQFICNTRYHRETIKLHEGLSYNLADKFQDSAFDFIYIDGSHKEEDIERDLQLFLPKLKPGGIIAGHDYVEAWPGVIRAVNNKIGTPDMVFEDTSWFKTIY